MNISEMFRKINNWAEIHRGLITLIGVIVAVTSAIGPSVLATLLSIIGLAPTLLAIVKPYSTMGVLSGLFLMIIGAIVRVQALNARLSNLERSRPRYLFTQGGTVTDPVWEFELILLGNGSVNSLLRTSGGARFDELTEEQKREWQECTMTLQNRSITLARRLTGTGAGNTQNFRGNTGPTQRTIRNSTAVVWEGTWSGFGADNAPGGFIVYLD